MWPYYPEILAGAVPRYTSYPPATAFSGEVGAAEQADALRDIAADAAISLYLHVPYCESICWYCGCNTGAAGKAQRLGAYVAALESEIALVADCLAGRGKVVRIAFGGGSPNAIEPEAFLRLSELLATRFAAEAAEISVEIDPRSLTPDWVEALGQAGVRRVSFGVQSFDPAIQAAIGRIQPVGMIADCMRQLRQRGIGSINFDLMYGLPLQDIARLDQTLDDVARLRPDRIALFGYAHMPGLFPRQRRIDSASLPDAGARFEMAAHGHERLIAEGYVAVGFDHFALPGDSLARAQRDRAVHRNFQGFTDDPAEAVIGLGASAISVFPDRLVQNEKRAGDYRARCAAGELAGARGVIRSASARLRGRVIEAILCQGRITLDRSLRTPATARGLQPFVERGLVELSGTELALAEAALPYARHIAAVFDATLTT